MASISIPKKPKLKLEQPTSNFLVSGIHKFIVERIIWSRLFIMSLKKLRSPKRAIKSLLKLEKLRRDYMGNHRLNRLVSIDHKYSWHPNIPSWPSKAFYTFHENELNRIDNFREIKGELNLLILSITKKCPLNCEHCFEWDIMHKKEVLSLNDLKQIIKKHQDIGLASLELSGGEPLSRFSDLLKLIEYASAKSEVWVLTSGFGLTSNKAIALKKAGLTGVTISLDHFEKSKHNAFRGNENSYYWVMEAIKNAQKNRLTTCLSICATQSFTTDENLMNYIELAKKSGVSYVQILEPKAKGKYANKDVFLSEDQIEIITKFQHKINTVKKYKDYPIIIYHGYHQRRMGCMGGGNRYKYIDSNGDIYPCPFCNSHMGNALDRSKEINNQPVECDSFEFEST